MNQKVLQGRGTLKSLGAEIDRLGMKRVLLITGRHSYSQSGAEKSLQNGSLDSVENYRFYDYSPNPTIEEALAGTKCFLENGCDGLIAIGGGSAIDVGKAIRALQSHPGFEKQIITGEKKLTETLPPLIAIPTTSGTGSEATHFSVIYMGGTKYSIAAGSLLPDSVILDASLTDSLPSYITACTGFDALGQAIESFWAKSSTQESRQYAMEAIPLLLNNIVDAVNKPSPSNRDNMMLAAYKAGKAINISKTTAPHALSYKITTLTGLPHGHAVALTLGYFFIINETQLSELDIDTARTLERRFAELYRCLGVDSAEAAKTRWLELMQQCGLKTNYGDIGLTGVVARKIVDGVNSERLSNHPVNIDQAMLAGLFSIER